MNKLSLLGSCQQVVMINYSAIKSHVKEPNVPIVSKYSKKNHLTANRSIYTCPIFQTIFLNKFWVTAVPLKHSSLSMLQFSYNISQHFMATL